KPPLPSHDELGKRQRKPDYNTNQSARQAKLDMSYLDFECENVRLCLEKPCTGQQVFAQNIESRSSGQLERYCKTFTCCYPLFLEEEDELRKWAVTVNTTKPI
ncbi:Hypothetical predicted protein, partial [Paramuricea clavata]